MNFCIGTFCACRCLFMFTAQSGSSLNRLNLPCCYCSLKSHYPAPVVSFTAKKNMEILCLSYSSVGLCGILISFCWRLCEWVISGMGSTVPFAKLKLETCLDGWMCCADVWMSEWMCGCTVRMYGWVSGCIDERADVSISEWMYGCTVRMYGWASGCLDVLYGCMDERVDVWVSEAGVWVSERMYGWASGCLDERADVWVSERMYGWASGCMGERADIWMSERMYGWVSGCLERRKDRRAKKSYSQTQRQVDGRTSGQTLDLASTDRRLNLT